MHHRLWLQISAGGKTLSLGDHETEQEAARAFDRALLHKQGRQAKTNFPLAEYESEMEHLQGGWVNGWVKPKLLPAAVGRRPMLPLLLLR